MKYFVVIFAVMYGPHSTSFVLPWEQAHLPVFTRSYECDDWVEAYNKLRFWPGGDSQRNVLKAYCIETEQ